MNSTSFVDKVDQKIQDMHLLNHSFYQSWNEGSLSLETIREYSSQYFKHVSAFPRYLSAIHSNCDHIGTRKILLENLNDEEMGPEDHPELWMRFAEGMGNTRDEVKNAVLMEETEELVNTFNQLSRSEDYLKGLAALYCYESMQPEISKTKKEGLQNIYGIKDEETLKFFTVHMQADEWHREVIRNLLVELCNSREKKEDVLEAVNSALGALNNFLSGMEKNYC
tara:strand:+ start:2010 stop:2681 length:672 start_codon:yes stop_codon:yes gene_type:complete